MGLIPGTPAARLARVAAAYQAATAAYVQDPTPQQADAMRIAKMQYLAVGFRGTQKPSRCKDCP